jgi:hypothetical protein
MNFSLQACVVEMGIVCPQPYGPGAPFARIAYHAPPLRLAP